MVTGEAVARQVRALAVQPLALGDLVERLDAVLRRAVRYDVGAWGTVDPATLLSTSCRVLGDVDGRAEDRERIVFALEHDEREPNRLADLARRSPPVGGLHDTTGGTMRAPRTDAVLRPAGMADDARVAFVADGSCWGSLYAYRRSAPFDRDDLALLGAVAGDVAVALRLALLRGAAQGGASSDGGEAPGLLLVTGAGAVVPATEPGRRWWTRLAEGSDGVPAVLLSVAAALGADPPGPSSARVRTADGTWAVVHASRLSEGAAALIVEAARPVEVAEVLVAAYGLSPRERDVTGLVLRGEGNRAVAKALGISEHTVKEHLKSVFAKTGVLSRAELAATLLREQYLPRRDAGVPPSPYGWFRESA